MSNLMAARLKPSSGGATLRYYDRKFHNKFIGNARSSLERESSEKANYRKLKASLEGSFEKGQR